MSVFTIIISLTVLFQSKVYSLNILGVFPYPGKSHFLGYEPLLKELAKKGHTVTVISYFPQKIFRPNYNDISLAGKTEIYENSFSITSPSYIKIIYVGLYLIQTGINNCKVLLSDTKVQDLWQNERKFDVVITEQFNSDCALGIAHKLNAPVIGVTSYTLIPYHYSRYGIPNNPSYTPFQLLNGGSKPSFVQRIERTVFTIYFQYFVKSITQTIDEYTLSQYFGNIPHLEELARNIKFLLLYNHFVFPAPSVLSTNVIQVGGFHVPEPKPLPKELQRFINESKHGVLVISFGTMLNSSSIPHEKLVAIINAVRELKQGVVWKWDSNTLPGDLKNVYISKWLPQNDILAHPKVKAFFSHCGMLGLTEAIHHGVPVIGMPIFGDQPYNAAAIEESRLGVQIQFDDLTKEKLLEKIRTVLDKKFKENVKRISKMWHDRPISARESAVFWVEYTARYHNITFRAAAADVPLYQYFCLDVIASLSIFFISFLYITKYLIFLFYTKKVKKNIPKKQKLR